MTPLTDEQKIQAIALARRGLALASVGASLKFSRSRWERIRAADPDFDGELQAAIAGYDAELLSAQDMYVAGDDPAKAAVVWKLRSERFPQWYAQKQEWRASEDHMEDVGIAAKDSAPATELAAAIETVLDAVRGK